MTLDSLKIKTITITEEAAKAVLGIFKDKELDAENNYLRVYISGQGCSGYQYGLGIEKEKRESDFVFEGHGVKVLVDDSSIEYMNGSSIDFVTMDGQSGFKVENPNVAASTCGTGDSSSCGGSC
jgi:iron-sulfur cluster assembly accessory protein